MSTLRLTLLRELVIRGGRMPLVPAEQRGRALAAAVDELLDDGIITVTDDERATLTLPQLAAVSSHHRTILAVGMARVLRALEDAPDHTLPEDHALWQWHELRADAPTVRRDAIAALRLLGIVKRSTIGELRDVTGDSRRASRGPLPGFPPPPVVVQPKAAKVPEPAVATAATATMQRYIDPDVLPPSQPAVVETAKVEPEKPAAEPEPEQPAAEVVVEPETETVKPETETVATTEAETTTKAKREPVDAEAHTPAAMYPTAAETLLRMDDTLQQLVGALIAQAQRGALEPSDEALQQEARLALCRKIAVLLRAHGPATYSALRNGKLSADQRASLREALRYGQAVGAWRQAGSHWHLVNAERLGLVPEVLDAEVAHHLTGIQRRKEQKLQRLAAKALAR